MVKSCILPFGWLMADSATRAKLTIMRVFCSMTGDTIFGRALILSIHMAHLAGNSCMCADQWEGSSAMIKGNVRPLRRLMTGLTTRAKLSFMRILYGMTGETILWRTFILTVHMA